MDEDRAAIGRQAAEDSNIIAFKKFKRSFPDLGKGTVHLFKKKYFEAVKQRAVQGDSSPGTSKRMGSPLNLGDLDTKVQQYVCALRQADTPVGSEVVIAAAKGFFSVDGTLLADNGVHIKLMKTWVQSLMRPMGLVKRKTSTKKPNISDI